ncbi:MAG TPA: alpha/beta hydrolase [Anaerolineae bacterium]|nr:alpha/beta hydrolase [Anaerolineae bacterium]
MASLQTALIRMLMRRLKLFDSSDIDVIKVRDRADRFGGRIPVHRKVSVSRVEADGVPSEWLLPPDAPEDRALLYLHGGAWILGSTELYRSFVSRLAFLAQTKALVINYRLAPEHPFPAGLEDCLTAFHFLTASGIRPENIVVAGDSAGGNLTLALLVALRDRGSPLPGAAAVISPATDLTGSGLSYQSRAEVDPLFGGHETGNVVQWYTGDHEPDHPLISPLFAKLHGLPPILLHVGDHEVLLDDSTRFAERARSFGVDANVVVWPKMFHVFHIFSPLLPEARKANREIADFIRRHQSSEHLH